MTMRRALMAVSASTAVTPLVVAGFALLYVGLSFTTDDVLVKMITLVRETPLLLGALLLVPVNMIGRLAVEVRDHLLRRRAMKRDVAPQAGLFHEEIPLPAGNIPEEAESFLVLAGYRTTRATGRLSGRRGISLFPSRCLSLVGGAALFAGIALSLFSRQTFREPLIEGEELPALVASGGSVAKIELSERSRGLIFSQNLTVQARRGNGSAAEFGLYPPGRIDGWFVYPRFLGVAPLVRFSAPDFQGIDSFAILMIYPPGQEDVLEIPESPYRLIFRLAPDSGKDPYENAAFIFVVRVEKGGAAVGELTVPAGGEASRDGYVIGVPEVKRMVAADLIRDNGIYLVWSSFIFFVLAVCWYLPVRLLTPRREILIITEGTMAVGLSRSEGRRRGHAEIFHNLLDELTGMKGEQKNS